MTEEFPPGRTSTEIFFRPPDINPSARRITTPVELTPNTCRWCLQQFDPAGQQPRTTWERGQLRTRLMMADNGSELIICDNCWHGAFGSATFIHGQAVPCSDPNEIPNPLLRALTQT
jgi:hypothetical protein